MAMKAAPETLAYVAAFDPERKTPDAIAVVDVDPHSKSYGKIIHTTAMPNAGDELHHFGWNACCSASARTRRIRMSSGAIWSCRACALRASIFSIRSPTRGSPKIVKVIEPEEVPTRPATRVRTRCIAAPKESMSPRSATARQGDRAASSCWITRRSTCAASGRWIAARISRLRRWWHLGHDTLITSEWGTPDTFENGLVPEVLLGAKYGRRLHFWDLHRRKHLQTIDFGDKYQLVFELRPAHDPTKAYGFVSCVISLEDLSSSIWIWYRDGDSGR